MLFLARFVVNKPSAKVCEMDVNEENFQSLKYAVDNHYWYQMYIGMYCHFFIHVGLVYCVTFFSVMINNIALAFLF